MLAKHSRFYFFPSWKQCGLVYIYLRRSLCAESILIWLGEEERRLRRRINMSCLLREILLLPQRLRAIRRREKKPLRWRVFNNTPRKLYSTARNAQNAACESRAQVKNECSLASQEGDLCVIRV